MCGLSHKIQEVVVSPLANYGRLLLKIHSPLLPPPNIHSNIGLNFQPENALQTIKEVTNFLVWSQLISKLVHSWR